MCRYYVGIEGFGSCLNSCSKIAAVLSCCSLKRASSMSVSSRVAGADPSFSIDGDVIKTVSIPCFALET